MRNDLSLNSPPGGPRFQELAARLRGELADGRWPVGARMPPTRELARTHGVSLNTVRRVIGRLAEEGLVRAHHGSGVYVLPKPTTQDHSNTIGVLVPNTQRFGLTVDGIEHVINAAGYRLSLACHQYDYENETDQLGKLVGSGVDGLIAATSFDEAGGVPAGHAGERPPLLDVPVPVVLVERRPPARFARHVSSVTSDIEGAVHDVVSRLIRHGRRRIGFYGPGSSTMSLDTHLGFTRAIEEAGLPLLGSAVVAPGEAPRPPQDFVETALTERVDALFIAREVNTLAVLLHLRGRGVAVPDDVAIMEFCDVHAATAEVPLSGIALPRNEVGRIAAQLLLRSIDAGPDAVVSEVRIQPRLKIRDSCGTATEPQPEPEQTGAHS